MSFGGNFKISDAEAKNTNFSSEQLKLITQEALLDQLSKYILEKYGQSIKEEKMGNVTEYSIELIIVPKEDLVKVYKLAQELQNT